MSLLTHKRLSTKLLLPLLLTSLIVVGGVLAIVSYTRTQAIEQAGLTTGRAVANQIVVLRSFYTAEVASRAKKSGMTLGFDYAEKDGMLPLPATLVKALGASVAKAYPGTNVQLMSKYPFTGRPSTPLDEFQSKALSALEKDPKTPQQRVEEINGRLSVRYAVADVMKEACVSCHNNHPLSTKRDWKVGDVRGIVEVVVPVDQLDQSISQSAMSIMALLLIGFGLIGSVLYILTNRVVSQPLEDASKLMEKVAEGDLTVVPPQGNSSELVRLFGAMSNMVTKLRQTVGEVRQSADSIHVASSEVATGNLSLSTRTEQAASNLQETSSSMDHLTNTVRQSAEAAHQANQLASSASAVAQRGGEVVTHVVTTMDEINNSSKKIADIIGVIDGIAFQTNILALNAAVEAARAGEQGRGFAVVAGEVRSLAQRSAEAAREIKTLIGNSVDKVEIGARLVQDAGTTMTEIVESVKRVSDIIGEITAASTEQSAGIGQINSSVSQLDQMTQQNAALVEEGAAAAESLKEQAENLTRVVSAFRLDNR